MTSARRTSNNRAFTHRGFLFRTFKVSRTVNRERSNSRRNSSDTLCSIPSRSTLLQLWSSTFTTFPRTGRTNWLDALLCWSSQLCKSTQNSSLWIQPSPVGRLRFHTPGRGLKSQLPGGRRLYLQANRTPINRGLPIRGKTEKPLVI